MVISDAFIDLIVQHLRLRELVALSHVCAAWRHKLITEYLELWREKAGLIVQNPERTIGKKFGNNFVMTRRDASAINEHNKVREDFVPPQNSLYFAEFYRPMPKPFIVRDIRELVIGRSFYVEDEPNTRYMKLNALIELNTHKDDYSDVLLGIMGDGRNIHFLSPRGRRNFVRLAVFPPCKAPGYVILEGMFVETEKFGRSRIEVIDERGKPHFCTCYIRNGDYGYGHRDRKVAKQLYFFLVGRGSIRHRDPSEATLLYEIEQLMVTALWGRDSGRAEDLRRISRMMRFFDNDPE